MTKSEDEYTKELIRSARLAFEAIDMIPHGVAENIRPREARHKLRLAWLACRDILQDIRTIEIENA